MFWVWLKENISFDKKLRFEKRKNRNKILRTGCKFLILILDGYQSADFQIKISEFEFLAEFESELEEMGLSIKDCKEKWFHGVYNHLIDDPDANIEELKHIYSLNEEEYKKYCNECIKPECTEYEMNQICFECKYSCDRKVC